MRVALIANARSGPGSDPAELGGLLEHAGVPEVEVCAVEELERARACEPARVVLAGGDGSIAPAAVLARDLGVPLAVLPVGTANDFARAMEIPRELEAAIALAADPEAGTVPCELGWIDGVRPFVNVASAGLAAVAAERAKPLKGRLGPLAYVVGAAQAGATAPPLEVRLQADGRTAFEGGAWQVIVGVTGAFGAGSGIGETDADDGLLDAIVVPAGLRLGLARRAWGLRTQSIADQAGVVAVRAAALELVSLDGEPVDLNVDGEVTTVPARARFGARARAFRLVVP